MEQLEQAFIEELG